MISSKVIITHSVLVRIYKEINTKECWPIKQYPHMQGFKFFFEMI